MGNGAALSASVLAPILDSTKWPTSSSWLNQVERFFALITGRMIRRGTFHSAGELEKAIYQWLAQWNGAPTPFVWKASADIILDKVRRCKELTKTGD
jgi:putative transposase